MPYVFSTHFIKMTVRFRPITYILGRQLVETVLLYVLCKFALLAWAAWQPQYSHPACGTVRKHFAKPFSTSSSQFVLIHEISKCVYVELDFIFHIRDPPYQRSLL